MEFLFFMTFNIIRFSYRAPAIGFREAALYKFRAIIIRTPRTHAQSSATILATNTTRTTERNGTEGDRAAEGERQEE